MFHPPVVQTPNAPTVKGPILVPACRITLAVHRIAGPNVLSIPNAPAISLALTSGVKTLVLDLVEQVPFVMY